MNHIPEQRLIELALDTASQDGSPDTAHLASCEICCRELASLRDALVTVSGSGDTAEPSARLRTTVLGLADEAHRFEGFVSRVATRFDISEDAAREALAQIKNAANWEPGPLPGVRLFHLEGGPRVKGADVGLVSFEPGMNFPRHDHHGEELQLVLQGGFTEDTGRQFVAGDVLDTNAGFPHSFVVHNEEPCILALVLRGGNVKIL